MGETEEPPLWLVRGQIPCLDGLRAISIMLVLVAHFGTTTPYRERPFLKSMSLFGPTGVNIFFVISGFLITLLMFREEEARGKIQKISLPNFYKRRILRIVPAYLAYLLYVFVLDRVGVVRLKPLDWAAAFTYTVSFMVKDVNLVIQHLWSLSVEEHFYLIWPIAYLLLGKKKSAILLVATCLITPFARVFFFYYNTKYIHIWNSSPVRMDTIAWGCLLAYFVRSPLGWRCLKHLERSSTILFLLSAWTLVNSVLYFNPFWRYEISIAFAVEAIAIVCGLLALLSNPTSFIGRILEWKPMVTVGVLSYSIYLWQQPFSDPLIDRWMCRWPQNILIALAAGISCHVFIEKPFLLLKKRMR